MAFVAHPFTLDGKVYKLKASLGIYQTAHPDGMIVPVIYSGTGADSSLTDLGFSLGVGVSSTGPTGPLPLAARDADLSASWRSLCRVESLLFFLWPTESPARRLLGTSGTPLASSSNGFLVASSTGISYTSDSERDSTRGASVGAVAGVEETIPKRPPPTLELPHIKLILTISTKSTMSWKIK
ncbi:hypothetical protein B296_00045893 [Ensete ventricosum]|uniref:Uncharacterized protein n=1 Tax=Ensete ventricosum TaxID=4639 RepID=A0A426X9M9_ENSVE|nr:hypothetical protein B296_00045893 [Ensete ventricosum]